MLKVCPFTNLWRGASRALVRRFPVLIGVSLIALPMATIVTMRDGARFSALICTVSASVGALLIALCETFHK
jgi:hypothetical protein